MSSIEDLGYLKVRFSNIDTDPSSECLRIL